MAVQLVHLRPGALLASGAVIIFCLMLRASLAHCDAMSIHTAAAVNSPEVAMDEINPEQREETEHPKQKHDARETCIYTITTVTGRKWGAGTDSTISLRLYNNASQTVYFPSLDNAKNNFERGDVDKFEENGDCVDHICKMILYTDNSGFLPGWFVDSVSVSVTTAAAGNEVKTWQLHEWLPKDSSAAYFDLRDDC